MIYDTLKLIYLHFAYSAECKDLANLLWLVIIENIAFILVAYYGANAIIGRSSLRIKNFMAYLIIFIIIRILTFYYMNHNMKSIIEKEESWQCNAIYEGGLYIVTGLLELILVLILLYYGKIVKNYVEGNF